MRRSDMNATVARPAPRSSRATAQPDAAEQERVEEPIGSPERLRAVFARAAAAADRAVGVWLARASTGDSRALTPSDDRAADDLRSLRALVRASATAYARRLRTEGAPP